MVKVRFEMSLYCEESNVNGIIYTREAYEKAIKHGCEEIPIIAYDKNGNKVIIGSGDLSLTEDKVIFDGDVRSARFDCYVRTIDRGSTISDMEIVGVDFGSE